MPETASLAHMLTPVRSANQASRDIKSEGNSIPGQSATDRGYEDFDKVLSRKIDRQNEATPDDHPHENAASAETTSSNPDPLGPKAGNMGEQNGSEQADTPLENTDDTQLAAAASITGGVVSQKGLLNGQLPGQTQDGDAQMAVPLEKSMSATVTAEAKLSVSENVTADEVKLSVSTTVTADETKLPANGEQVLSQKQVMAEGANVSEGQNTDNKQPQAANATEQMPKQLSSTPDSEVQLPSRANQDKSVHPDFQAAVRRTQQEQQQGFSSSDNSGAADSFQGQPQQLKGVPFEAEISPDGHESPLKGLEVQNAQSVLHSAEPAENASLSALEAPARTGTHTNLPQAETMKPVDQIVHHLSSISVSGANQRIKLTLTPEHLGTIRITFNQTEDEVVGILEVQKNQTRRQVEQALPQLISAMQSSGVQVRRIEVVQWNTSQGSVEDETAKGSDYSAAGQFHDESSPHSSESEMSKNIHSAGHGQKSSQLSGFSGQESPTDGVDTTENSLNMFI